jgi:hypothetical protein
MATSAPSTTVATTVASLWNRMNMPKYVGLISAVAAVVFLAVTIGMMSTYIGTSDNLRAVSPQVMGIIGTTLACGLFLGLAIFFYFSTDPTYVITYIIITSSLAVAFSYSAIAMAAAKKI